MNVIKVKRHHNTDGRVQIRKGWTANQVERIARRLHIPYVEGQRGRLGTLSNLVEKKEEG